MNIFIILTVIFIILILYFTIVKFKKPKYLNLTIFCSSKDVSNKYKDVIKNLISRIDTQKYCIVYGGDNGGLMNTVSESWKGNIISVNFKKFKIKNDDYVYNHIFDRQRKLIELGDIYLILPGGLGTLSELMDVILLNEVSTDNNKKDILIFNYKGIYDLLLKHFDEMKNKKFIDNDYLDKFRIKIFDNVKDIIQYLDMFKNE
jgi:uncharacterized protein (TIGR00730 family)